MFNFVIFPDLKSLYSLDVSTLKCVLLYFWFDKLRTSLSKFGKPNQHIHFQRVTLVSTAKPWSNFISHLVMIVLSQVIPFTFERIIICIEKGHVALAFEKIITWPTPMPPDYIPKYNLQHSTLDSDFSQQALLYSPCWTLKQINGYKLEIFQLIKNVGSFIRDEMDTYQVQDLGVNYGSAIWFLQT